MASLRPTWAIDGECVSKGEGAQRQRREDTLSSHKKFVQETI